MGGHATWLEPGGWDSRGSEKGGKKGLSQVIPSFFPGSDAHMGEKLKGKLFQDAPSPVGGIFMALGTVM